MFIRNWKQEILTIPNLLSLFRLGLIPVYIHLYRNASGPSDFYAAGLVIAVSCLTDAADGKIARHFNMVSTLGKILDPLADKATQLALTVCLSLKYPVLIPVLGLFLVKEGVQLALGLIYLRRGQMLPGALMAGKVCTTVLFLSLTALVLFPQLPESLVAGIALTDGIFLLMAFLRYLMAYRGPVPQYPDPPAKEE